MKRKRDPCPANTRAIARIEKVAKLFHTTFQDVRKAQEAWARSKSDVSARALRKTVGKWRTGAAKCRLEEKKATFVTWMCCVRSTRVYGNKDVLGCIFNML